MQSQSSTSIIKSPAKFVSHKVISLETRIVERFVPDRLLLFYLNTLDNRVPVKAIDGVVNGLGKLPRKVRSSLITATYNYVPDAVASSRKASAMISGIGKYIPDRIVPPESIEDWEHVKAKFHIPTLIAKERRKLKR